MAIPQDELAPMTDDELDELHISRGIDAVMADLMTSYAPSQSTAA